MTGSGAARTGRFADWKDELTKLVQAETGVGADLAALAYDEGFGKSAAQLRFLRFISPTDLTEFKKRQGASAFLEWLLEDEELLNTYLLSGTPAEFKVSGLEIWHRIWTEREAARKPGIEQRFAMATALVHSTQINAMANGKKIEPLERFDYFIEANRNGQLFPYFNDAPVWELKYVSGAWALDTDLDWARETTDDKIKQQALIHKSLGRVPYRLFNSKGVSVQKGAAYYDYKPMTLKLMTEVGAVCGGISRFGTATAQAFGIPGMPVGQPGHCAFLTRISPTDWGLHYNISGWQRSTQHGGTRMPWGRTASYVLAFDTAYRSGDLLASERLRWIGDHWKGLSPEKSQAAYAASVEAQPYNVPAHQALTASGSQTPEDQAARITEAFGNYPIIMVDLIAAAETKLAKSILKDAGTRSYVQSAAEAVVGGDAKLQKGTAAYSMHLLIDRTVRRTTGRKKSITGIFNKKTQADTWKAMKPTEQRETVLAMEIAARSAMARPDVRNSILPRYMELSELDSMTRAKAMGFLSFRMEDAKTAGDKKLATSLCNHLIKLAKIDKDTDTQKRYQAELKLIKAS
jgi:hypothetical protein